jgi:2-amino-4-hydroxy-6-hydroxymethyldihydropteridine diphosphokinase
VLAYIGIGSNLGNRERHLAEARRRFSLMSSTKIIAESTIDETDPVDYTEQPRFLNQVVALETEIGPLELLDILKGIEREMGRLAAIPKGPRVIDLDILLYGDRIVNTERLTIPHHAIRRRRFVMRELLELDQGLHDPTDKQPYREVYDGTDTEHQ